MLFYRNMLLQNLFNCQPCCFIGTFCPKICSPYYHAVLSQYVVTKFVHLPTMLFYRNILSQYFFTNLPCCFIVTFCQEICSTYAVLSPTYHAVLS